MGTQRLLLPQGGSKSHRTDSATGRGGGRAAANPRWAQAVGQVTHGASVGAGHWCQMEPSPTSVLQLRIPGEGQQCQVSSEGLGWAHTAGLIPDAPNTHTLHLRWERIRVLCPGAISYCVTWLFGGWVGSARMDTGQLWPLTPLPGSAAASSSHLWLCPSPDPLCELAGSVGRKAGRPATQHSTETAQRVPWDRSAALRLAGALGPAAQSQAL